MAGLLIVPGLWPVFDANGDPVSGATIRFYEPGTTTPKAVYSDATLATSLGTVLTTNASGEPTTLAAVVARLWWAADAAAFDVQVTAGVSTRTWSSVVVSDSGLISLIPISNITALRAATWPSGRPTQAQVVSNWTTGDGGGEFRWDSASTATDDSGTIIKETAVTTGRWIRQTNEPANPKWFGAIGDGVTNDTAFIQAAIDAVAALGGGSVVLPPGNYRLQSTLTIPGKVRLIGKGAGRVFQPVQAAATTLSWYGGAAEMVRVGYQGATVVNGGIEGIRLDGRALATRGLAIKDLQHGVFEEIVITGATSSALYMTNSATFDPTGFCDFKGIQISLRGGATNSAHGILLDGTGTGVDGVTLCSWDDVRIEHANGDGVRVNERGDGMSWYNLFTFRAGVETGFGIRSTASASGVVSAWSFYNALPNGGVQIDTPNTALGWVFDTIQDIDVDATAATLIYGNGRSDVSVMTSASTRQKGPAKIRGFRNSVIEDPLHFRRWDSGNNILTTAECNYLTGGTYASSSIASASLPGGAVDITTGNVATNALYISAAGTAASGYALTYEPQMAATWTPITLTNCVYRTGFVGTFADLPDDCIYVEAAPATSAFYRCITRLAGAETATVTAISVAVAVVQWRIEYNSSGAQFFYRTSGNQLWALAASHTTNIPTVSLADVVYARTTEAASKQMRIYDYKIAWDLEA